MTAPADSERSYSLGAVVRLTGLGEHTIRAWERRHGAVRPGRSPGGTRRYSQADVARLQLLASAVAAGHRIGDVAGLPEAELEALLADLPREPSRPLDQVRAALDRLDHAELERMLGLQLSALAPEAFAREVAVPLLREVGDRWEKGDGTIAAEHLLTAVTRSILGAALRAAPRPPDAPGVVFTTPEGERHELGVLVAAVTAAGAGAAVTYLGPDLPAEEVVHAVRVTGAVAVALSVVTLPAGVARRYLRGLREALDDDVQIWVGGAAAGPSSPGVEAIGLDELTRRLTRMRRPSTRSPGS